MTPSQSMHGSVGIMVAIVTGIAATGWTLAPERANTWITGAATMAAIWIVVALIGRARSFNRQSNDERRYLFWSVAGAGLILSSSMALKLAVVVGFNDQADLERGLGLFMGVILLLLGNVLPKVLSPLFANRCVPAQVQTVQRVAGWSLALAGLISIGSWLLFAGETARDISKAAVATSLVIIVARCAWAYVAPRADKGK